MRGDALHVAPRCHLIPLPWPPPNRWDQRLDRINQCGVTLWRCWSTLLHSAEQSASLTCGSIGAAHFTPLSSRRSHRSRLRSALSEKRTMHSRWSCNQRSCTREE